MCVGVERERERARERCTYRLLYMYRCTHTHSHTHLHTHTHTRTHTHRWEAMILQDAAALQRAADAMGVGQYAKLFPLIFTMRAIDSRVKLVRVT
jgi:hypothetical protein